MSSDSNSDEDSQMKDLLDAVDTSLLSNSMFQRNEDVINTNQIISLSEENASSLKTDLKKSQRYLLDDIKDTETDFNLPDSMQKHLAKKLSEIVKQNYEFCDIIENELPKIKSKHKSRVKLLRGDNCFVNSYEDFEYNTKGPTTKPLIKRRVIDNFDEDNINKDMLKSIAVDGNYILSYKEVNMWAKKQERKDKVFYYKMAKDGTLYAKEENEFSKLKQRNKWNENKINNFKKN